jgi:Uma2 family endonuclease
VRKACWEILSAADRERFPPLCSDFVVELRSPSDRLPSLQRRLRELIRNGAQLGWLIDPQRCAVHIHRPGEAVQTLLGPTSLSGEPVLPGFVLDLGLILA